ncbi:MAG: pilus assembly protein PilM [Clostridia bacterium]|nr:pilus assembly protein PilM [Clostridia bacterium]
MAKVNSAIGIEYNSHEIRAVELEKTAGGSYEIKAFGREVYSNNVTANGIIADGGLFTVALNDLITRGGFTNVAPVVVGVNNENVIMRYATFPKVPDDKLRNVITMQAQDFIPVPVSELGLDFVVIDETTDDDDQPALNVLLVGARTMMLQNIIQSFENSKLEIVDIDSSFLAWCRVAIAEANSDETFGFLNLTDDVLDFVAIADKEIKMVRSINIPDRAMIEVKKAFNEPDELTSLELETIADLLYSELSSSINYFQMQTGFIMNSVLFKAATELEEKILEKLNEKSYVPLTIPKLYSEYSTASFDASDYAGCISLAKVALEG